MIRLLHLRSKLERVFVFADRMNDLSIHSDVCQSLQLPVVLRTEADSATEKIRIGHL